MYSSTPPSMFRRFRRPSPRTAPEGRTPRPQPIKETSEASTPRPQPIAPRWTGGWKPRAVIQTRSMGSLNDATSADPESYAPTPQPIASGWSSLWSGLASIITPAAQALAQTKAAAVVQQQQQKAMAQTWNPAITGPALQAQAWQTAYQTGSGTAPLGISGTTLAIGAAAVVGLLLITRK